MAVNTLIAWYLISGGNASAEKSYLKIESNYSIKVSGSTATATIVSRMYVHRDAYGPTQVGPGYSGGWGDCYITIDGTKKSVLTNWNNTVSIGNSYVTIGNAVTHTVTYDASQNKTVTIAAGFDIGDSGSSKLQDLIIPIASYKRGTAGIDSGSTSLTFPKQTTVTIAPTTFTVTPAIFENDVAIAWSGAGSGTNNTLNGYTVQYRVSTDGTTWGDWQWIKTITSSSGSGTDSIAPSVARGNYVQLRICTQGTAGSAYHSAWKESDIIRKNSAPVSPSTLSVNLTSVKSGTIVTLSWSAGSDIDNNLAKYRLTRRYKATTSDQDVWEEIARISSSAERTYSIAVTGVANSVTTFGIHSVDAFDVIGPATAFVNVVILDSSGVKYWNGSNWINGDAYVCINGVYKKGEVYVCKNGTYVKGIS